MMPVMNRTAPARLATVAIGIATRIQPAIITESDSILLLVDDTLVNLFSIFFAIYLIYNVYSLCVSFPEEIQ